MPATSEDHQIASELAEEAGRLLVELRQRLADADTPAAVLKAEGDRQAHELLMARLAALRPGDAVLSEEGKDDAARLDAARTWIVDPLDGTREFSEVPRTDWAVHVALVEDHRPIAGAVALPALGLVLSTHVPATLDRTPAEPPRMIVSRSRPPAAATHVAAVLGADLVEMGSAGAKTMAVGAMATGAVFTWYTLGSPWYWISIAILVIAGSWIATRNE